MTDPNYVASDPGVMVGETKVTANRVATPSPSVIYEWSKDGKVKAEKKFLGWGVDANTKRYNAGEKVSGLADDGQTKDLYAIWAVAEPEEKNLFVGTVADQTYTGSEIEPRPVVRLNDENGNLLVLNRDYLLSYDNNVNETPKGATDEQKATVTATGIGTYAGFSGSARFSIKPAPEKTFSVGAVGDQVYTGTPINPQPRVLVGEATLSFGKDYFLTYDNNVNVGTATIYVTGSGAYNGYSGTTTFQITAAPKKEFLTGAVGAHRFTGSEIEPKPEVRDGNTVLKLNRDYVLAYENNVDAGEGALIYVTGIGGYSGYSATVNFAIEKVDANDETMSVTAPADQPYIGSELTPKPTVTFDGKALAEGTDYALEYKNNVNAGTATITVTGKGNFAGERSVTFAVTKRDVATDTAIVAPVAQTYTGSAYTPGPTVTFDGAPLAEGTDYTLAYKDNVNAGTATVTVAFKGNYSGSRSATFKIGDVVPMYRLYNPYSGEHHYTASEVERDTLSAAGWNYEGIGWYAPRKSSAPVYCVFNPYSGDHHYTTSAGERDALVAAGWNDEGIGWYSDDAQGVALYRQYNPYAATGSHNYTTSTGERDMLVSVGWQDEGIGWYGVKMG